jgi:hypothetical protein
VDDAEVVQATQRRRDRGEHRDDLPRCEVPAGAHEPVERPAAQVRHDDREPPVGELEAALHRHDVRRRHLGGHRRLPRGGLDRAEAGVDDLDRDPTPVGDGHARPHLARAAARDQLAELEPRDVRHLRQVPHVAHIHHVRQQLSGARPGRPPVQLRCAPRHPHVVHAPHPAPNRRPGRELFHRPA